MVDLRKPLSGMIWKAMKGDVMKYLITSLILVSAALMFSACKKSNPVDSSNDQYIWPLNKGNSWSYHIVTYDSAGTAAGGGNFSFSVTSDTVVAGETWYNLSNFSDGMFCRNRSDGFWVMQNGVQFLFFKYPGAVGDNWNSGGQAIEIRSTDSSMTTPKGTFRCHVYRMTYNYQTGEYLDIYLRPGIGMVAEDYYSTTGAGAFYLAEAISLTDYTVN